MRLEYTTVGLSETAAVPTHITVKFAVYPNGNVDVITHAFNVLTWEDEYPFPGGFQCTLEDSVRFQYRSGEDISLFYIHLLKDHPFIRISRILPLATLHPIRKKTQNLL